MIINSVKLYNIRSYLDEKIDFPEGIVLLSGDIGCGKSTILLAIEFALFGIMRGGLSGTALLRHGKNEGSVELKMRIGEKDVIIYRALKRTKTSVAQGSGYIIEDGLKFEGTPVELKSKIITMIGYPDEMVTKSKSMIYRYTVYTPQEEMKAILFEGDEARLNTLRKIFNIDKYKRIKENCALLMRDMRSQKKMLQSRMVQLDELKQRVDEKEQHRKVLKEKHAVLTSKIQESEEILKSAKEALEISEKDAEDRKGYEKDYEITSSSLKQKTERKEAVQAEIVKLDSDIKALKEDLKDKDVQKADSIRDDIKSAEKDMRECEETLAKIREKEASRRFEKEEAQKVIGKIESLDKCPMCMQEVTDEHIEEVIGKQRKKISEADDKLQKASILKENISKKIDGFNTRLRKLRQEEVRLASILEKKKSLDERIERERKLQEENEKLTSGIQGLEKKKTILEKKLKETEESAKRLKKVKKSYEEKNEVMKRYQIEDAGIRKEIESLDEFMQDLNARLKDLQDDKKRLKGLNEYLDWLDKYFVNVIDAMEKHVMLKIYTEFNEYFMEWFNLLMEDESLSVRLDEKFCPVIIQDGYDTEIDYLSGGERTSVALAYRLSLNKVINDFIGTIRTKDLIILDEPTDGFSSEQLDNVRNVLRQLNVTQTIIVSHEAKMESYVDNIIRISKQNHASSLVSL